MHAFGPRKTDCPICAHTKLRPDFTRELIDHVILRWVSCRHCGFTFMNPPLAPEEMRRIYNTAAYWQDGAYADYLDGESVRLLNNRARMARIADYVNDRGRWLDIGCATGSFAQVVQEHGYSVIGIDPAEAMTRYGRERYGLDLRAMTVEEFDAGAGRFDVVSLWGTDSHFSDVRGTFGRIVGLLAPGGHLVFNYQDYQHWIRRVFPAIKQNINVYYNFTSRSIRIFLDQLGLQLVSERMEWQITQLHRITRTIRVGDRLLSRWDAVQLRVPAISYYAVVARKL